MQTLKKAFHERLFGEGDPSVIVEFGYTMLGSHLCTLYIINDGDDDYTQLPVVALEPQRRGAYGPCPYLTSKQLSFVRRRIVERTLRCSPAIRHLFGFRLLIHGSQPHEVKLLGYRSTLEEPEGEVLLSLCEPETLLQFPLDLPYTPVLASTGKKRRVHCVNTTITSPSESSSIAHEVLLAAAKSNKVKIFHNQTLAKPNERKGDTSAIRLVNVLGYGATLREAQTQAVLACEYIKQHAGIDDLAFETDIASDAIQW